MEAHPAVLHLGRSLQREAEVTTDMIAQIGFVLAAVSLVAAVLCLIVWALGDRPP